MKWVCLPAPFTRYSVSDNSEVIDHKHMRAVEPSKGRSKNAYWKVNVVLDKGKRTTINIHRLMALGFYQETPEVDLLHARHLDGDKDNNSIENIVFGTVSENYADRVRHQTDNSGSRNGQAGMTESSVWTILMARKVSGLGARNLSEILPYSEGQISYVLSGKGWKEPAKAFYEVYG